MKKLFIVLAFIGLLSCDNKKHVAFEHVSVRQMGTASSQSTNPETINLRINSMYTVFVTKDIEASKNFYSKWFDYKIIFESTWFILLSAPGDNAAQLAFIHEKHPSSPPEPKAFSGNGAFLTIDVTDAKTWYEKMKSEGASFSYHLKDEPWGQRRFAVTDPNGIWVDIVEQIEPQKGWWDKYLK